MLPSNHHGRFRELGLIDMQSGGDVSRIVYEGIENIPGSTVLEKMRYLQAHGDGLRRLLLSEPYGDPAMSVDLIVPPSHPDAQAGYIIMEAMGYPMYSGSNTICTATAALQSGLIPMQEGEQSVVLESPAGLAHIKAVNHNGRVDSITTQGEPAYVAARGLTVTLPRGQQVTYDMVWSGAFFAMVDASQHGFELVHDEAVSLAAFGDEFIRAVREQFNEPHPQLGEAGPVPFAHFMGPVEALGDGGFRSRSATYVHPGVICRSPTGTGTSARLALMAEKGLIREGQWLETVSPRNSSFIGTCLGEARVGVHPAIHSHITGRAWTLSHSHVLVDLDDPLVDISDLEHLMTPPRSQSLR
ncbi:proline racemase family protein [Marinimicrobium agarilyticum]|uniref:proline racemase family protein n=1 Tax=Marinimicrobium agarilyticum TaxID=306546 RepID=UPI00040809F5|nr:proline racemase family protein [Marinimicrobium agarilyticum]